MSKHISKSGESVKKYQTGWNLSTQNIDNIAYDIIFLVLKESNDEYIEINTLIRGIEKKSKHYMFIYKNNRKSLMKYIKIEHRSLTKFLDKYDKFGISKKNNRVYIKLMEDYLEGWNIIDNDKIIDNNDKLNI
tara:strand:+ start:23 stop:421 length:399 start_codon:yes stop_codon:yes gene_type:complete